MRLLQSRETRLRRRLEKNQQKQVRVIRHPLYQEHLQSLVQRMKENQELPQHQFNLHRLL